MFLKHLTIENVDGVIRDIPFRPGLNLIVDETPTNSGQTTGNNVGKTTVLKLIDMCLGAEPKRIYTDLENPRVEYADVKRFLVDTKVLVRLTLCESFKHASERDIVLERNFLPRKQLIRQINGVACTESEFEAYLTNHLFPGHYGNKPTFPQIISHNIRYKEPGVSHTLKTLNAWTRDDEYEALYLFLLGLGFDRGNEKQELLTKLRTETTFKQRLEAKASKSQYEISLNMVLDEIEDLEHRKDAFKRSPDLSAKITTLSETKYRKSVAAAELARLQLRSELVTEAVAEVRTRRSDVDVQELRQLYDDVSDRLAEVTHSFEELLAFHNKMIDEKVRYIAKDIPQLREKIAAEESNIAALTALEHTVASEIAESAALEDLELVVNLLNERHRKRGELEQVIDQISESEKVIEAIEHQLTMFEKLLFSKDADAKLRQMVRQFNSHFSAISDELYGEKYALNFDRTTTPTGQQIYKFSCFNTNNFSSGKKQGEINCFDIAYTLFADEATIPCYHFLLYDKKELMHDNQLARIGNLVERKSDHIQFVASILRDKLPAELDQEKFIVVRLSQRDKLFRIESGGRKPKED